MPTVARMVVHNGLQVGVRTVDLNITFYIQDGGARAPPSFSNRFAFASAYAARLQMADSQE